MSDEAPGSPRAGGFADAFWLQWHLTDACNLDCSHCYRDSDAGEHGHGRERSLPELEGLLERYQHFLDSRGLRGRIQFCGGEPLLAQGLLPLLRQARRRHIPARVLSNGTPVTSTLANELRGAGARIVQVSLDGDRAAHDEVRGNGSFDRARRGVELLAKAGIDVTVAATVRRSNLDRISAIIDCAVEAGARRVAFHRILGADRGLNHVA